MPESASLSERIDTTTAAGKMVFRMLAVLAEFERDQVAERTKVVSAHLRNQGKRISGKIPYGYDLAEDGETLVSNPTEQCGLQLIQRLRAKGLGRRRIAAHSIEEAWHSHKDRIFMEPPGGRRHSASSGSGWYYKQLYIGQIK